MMWPELEPGAVVEGSYGLYLIYLTGALLGARRSLVVKALGYKKEGRGFETLWGKILKLPNPSGRTRPWGLLSL
jgi:hypothetical protein